MRGWEEAGTNYWGPGHPEGGPKTDHVAYVFVFLGSVFADQAQVTLQLRVKSCRFSAKIFSRSALAMERG